MFPGGSVKVIREYSLEILKFLLRVLKKKTSAGSLKVILTYKEQSHEFL